MGDMKTWWITIALALLACLFVFGLQSSEPVAPSGSRPWFDVRVVKPRMSRPLAGLLPESLFGNVLRFDNASPGAEIGRVGHDRLELRAEGWDLSIAIDAEGRVTPETRLVFSLELGGKQRTLRGRPADPAIGYLRTNTQAGPDELGGTFLVELATCETAETGKLIDWPPAPLTVRGSFERLPMASPEIAPADITPADITPADITPADITPADITPAEQTGER
jgi:hypothetical protein